jgi:carboxylesterase type B
MASNITFNATATIAVMAGCLNTSSSFTFAPGSASQSRDVISCLQALSMETLLNVTSLFISETTALTDGDVFLPTVDQDFLPCLASELVSSGKFPTMPLILGWEEDDGTLFTPPALSTPEDTQAFVSLFWPNLHSSTVSQLLDLYPSTDFQANAVANLSAEFYRGAAIFRDIVFVCPSLFFGHAMAVKYSTSPSAPSPVPVYLFDNNQTVLAALFASTLLNMPGLGVMHGSEMFYLYDDFSLLANAGIPGYTFSPTTEDYALESELPRSWTSFAWTDNPSLAGSNNNTLPGWTSAYPEAKGSGNIYVIGGAQEGMAGANGTKNSQIKKQRLGTRCGFLNSAPVVEQLKY